MVLLFHTGLTSTALEPPRILFITNWSPDDKECGVHGESDI